MFRWYAPNARCSFHKGSRSNERWVRTPVREDQKETRKGTQLPPLNPPLGTKGVKGG
jgi:hypothetical protein